MYNYWHIVIFCIEYLCSYTRITSITRWCRPCHSNTYIQINCAKFANFSQQGNFGWKKRLVYTSVFLTYRNRPINLDSWVYRENMGIQCCKGTSDSGEALTYPPSILFESIFCIIRILGFSLNVCIQKVSFILQGFFLERNSTWSTKIEKK